MAAANRKKKTTPRRAAPKRPQKKVKQGFPFLAFSIAVAITAFLGYFIFAVEKPEPVKVAPKPAPVVKKEEVLPAKPEPKWQYEKSLQNKEVIVDIPEEQKNTRPYKMQCGSFRNKADAESMKAKIAFQGLNSIVEPSTSGKWYRVFLGPYERKRNAEKDRHKLQRIKINSCQIWHWN